MTSRSTFNCFGLVIHGYDWDEIHSRISENESQLNTHTFEEQRPFWIVTANPEILLFAKKNPWYWEIIRRADLRTVDGFGLQLAGIVGGAKPKRITGVFLAESLLQHAVQQGWSVGITGGRGESADKAVWHLREKYPSIQISIIPVGEVTPRGSHIQDDSSLVMQQEMTQTYPDVILVALGHPKQEAWIAKHLTELQASKIVVGVGGTIDFWSGKAKRAPRIFQYVGLEWAWRLLAEPKRWKRIFNAVFLFPLELMRDRFQKKHF